MQKEATIIRLLNLLIILYKEEAMKRKLIVGIILMALIFIVNFNVCTVEAFSGELDPENYITLPSVINIQNGVGTGTIKLSSSASDYAIAYQKVDITESQKNNITNKSDELNAYVSSSKTTLQEKENNVRTLQNEYQTLVNSGTATNEQLTVAQTAYNEAYEDYRNFYDTASTEITKLQNELYALIPDYTNSWTTTTNTNNNVQLDFKNYSGIANFILWVKITNGTNTYYDMDIYSSIIEQEETITINKSSETIKVDETLQLTATSSKNSTITWTSSNPSIATVSSAGLVKGIKEGTVVITAKGKDKSATCNITVKAKDVATDDWTDFSNAKFELKKDGISKAMIQISNVVPKANRRYCLFITSDSNKPNVTSQDFDEILELDYDTDTKTFKTIDSDKIASYVELNQDLYITILEKKSYNDEKIVLYGKKVERYAEPKYSDAFHATFLANDRNQLITTFTHAKENNRKIQIKVGKITDQSILQKLKNQDSSGFAELLSFAKTGKGIFNKTVDADKDDNFAIEYNADATNKTGNSVINLTGLEDEAYYFLYVKADDENGKYIPQEAVTLAQARVYENGWGLFFYGSSDFKWANLGDDNTTAKGDLPQTGVNSIICFTLGIAIICVGTFSYVQYKKNNF